jgi:hypothetical protein
MMRSMKIGNNDNKEERVMSNDKDKNSDENITN